MKSMTISAIVMATALCLNTTVNAAEWLTLRKYKAESKAMKSAGKYPQSIKCRADPGKRVFKPQIQVKWIKNNGNKLWFVYAYKGQLDFKPGPPEKAKQWRRVNKFVLKTGAGGSTFRCSLFHQR